MLPVVSRLLDPIEGMDEQIIAKCFGMNPSDFKSKDAQRLKIMNENKVAAVAIQKAEERFAACELL